MENAEYLDQTLVQFPFILPMKKDSRITKNAYHLYVFRFLRDGIRGLSRDAFLRALAAENVCVVADGYSSPIYEMEFLRSDAFFQATGRVFTPPAASQMQANERAAREEGCWMYHSSLLGSKSDMDRIVEAFDRIAAQAEALGDAALAGEG